MAVSTEEFLHQAVEQELRLVKGLLNGRFGLVDMGDGSIILFLYALWRFNNLKCRYYWDIQIWHCLPNSHIFNRPFKRWERNDLLNVVGTQITIGSN